MRANISHTLEEIERAKKDFPELHIATIETEWKRADVQQGVIGYVSGKLNDVALLSLQMAASNGRLGRDDDVLLIRNDADPKGIRVNYLKRYIDEFKSNQEVDVFTGTTSFDQTKASRLPGFVFAANFMQTFNIISASREGASFTGGANFGVRASTLAAVGSVGFGDDTGAGSDDVNIGRRIKSARSGKINITSRKSRYNQPGINYNQTDSNERTKRRIGLRVHGARIDTDSDRGEKLYAEGIPIAYQWNPEHDFNKDGYKPRDNGLSGEYRESLATKRGSDIVIESIRNDMEGTINIMGESAITDVVLNLTFSGLGSKAYNLTHQPKGGYSFNFTPEGSEYLKRYLSGRNISGLKGSYGKRKMRFYGYNTESPTQKMDKIESGHASMISL